jgi:hypothetical protein
VFYNPTDGLGLFLEQKQTGARVFRNHAIFWNSIQSVRSIYLASEVVDGLDATALKRYGAGVKEIFLTARVYLGVCHVGSYAPPKR